MDNDHAAQADALRRVHAAIDEITGGGSRSDTLWTIAGIVASWIAWTVPAPAGDDDQLGRLIGRAVAERLPEMRAKLQRVQQEETRP